MSTTKNRLIAFDLDDTLYKERDFVASGQRHIALTLARRYGFDYGEMLRAMQTAPLNPFDTLSEYLAHRGAQAGIEVGEDIAWMVDTYRRHTPDIHPAEGVADTLRVLAERGYRLALVTDGRSVTQRAKIESLGLGEFIDPYNIAISQEVGGEKIDPVAFKLLMKLNADCDAFAYVGDNPMKDFVWPNRLGWLTIMLADNGRNVHSQKISLPHVDYAPRMVVEHFSQLLDIFL